MLTLGSVITLIFTIRFVSHYRTHGHVYMLLVTTIGVDVLNVVNGLAEILGY